MVVDGGSGTTRHVSGVDRDEFEVFNYSNRLRLQEISIYHDEKLPQKEGWPRQENLVVKVLDISSPGCLLTMFLASDLATNNSSGKTIDVI